MASCCKYPELREAVDRVAAVDAHAHPLVAKGSSFPFLRCFSEAEGDALELAADTLSFKRSIRDIARLYNSEMSLHGVERHRDSSELKTTASKCFAEANISAVFIDDGIQFDKMHDWKWHSCIAPAVGRILRIEHLAEMIINEEFLNDSRITIDSLTGRLVTFLKSEADKIVAIKSIAAYRSGLEIDTSVSKKAAEEGLIEDLNAKKPVRIQNKNLIDYIFTVSLEVASSFDLPIQVHTGFGDKDLDLRLSNPLLLRKVLEDRRFSKCRIVLLHASYPFSREASYLASMYSQVYLDFGLAVPKLSVHGMTACVKELLELAPMKKVMFSTDGYAFPETFYLGAKRAREVIYSVMSDACDDGDLTVSEAVAAIEGIFRNNALKFYDCNKVIGSVDSTSLLNITTVQNWAPENIVFVRLLWVDASGQTRCRAIPAQRFYEVIKNTGLGLTFASMGMSSYCDGPSDGSGLTAVGEIRLVPDLSTKHTLPWSKHEEMVLGDMQIKLGEAWEYCPRETLRRLSQILEQEFNLTLHAGFENEFYLLKSILRDGEEQWVSFDLTPYCSTCGFDAASSILQEMYSSIVSLGISIEQLHAESGKGQFEMALGHTICNKAADNLVFVREAIKSVARKHGLLATFVPKYFLDDIGSGCHVHLSLWKNGKNVFMATDQSETPYGMSRIGEQFMAGVFYHLPAILAIIAPMPNSYDRIQPNTWSGAYHCWGRENREAPLRTACPPGASEGIVTNFEIKPFDGCANQHIGLASIIAAGIDGLRRKVTLPKPVDVNPSTSSSAVKRLPKDLRQSVEALEEDSFLRELLGEKLVTAIVGIRLAEIDYYAKNKEAFKQLIHRY